MRNKQVNKQYSSPNLLATGAYMAMLATFLLGPEGARAQFGATISPPAPLSIHAAPYPNGLEVAPALATDGRGTWIAVWQFSDTSAQPYGSDVDILIARSTDNGQTWSTAVPLNSDVLTDQYTDGLARIATDGSGNWIVVWASDDVVNGQWDSDLEFVRSGDNGATWTASAFLNTNAATDVASDLYPHLATDGSGNWVVVWEAVHADYDVLMARSGDGGATWTAPQEMPPSGALDNNRNDRLPRVATDRLGNWLVTWASNNNLGGTIGDDHDILLLRSFDEGRTWTAPVALNADAASDSNFDETPDLATDGRGNWVTVWRSIDGADSHLVGARSSDYGATWTMPVVVGTTRGVAPPRITVDRQGNWVVAWETIEIEDGGPLTDYDLLVSRSANQGASWTRPEYLNTNARTDGLSDDRAPEIAFGEGGRWLAVWSHIYDILFAYFEFPPEKSLTRYTIAGGGIMRSTGGTLELSGTIGQFQAGELSSGRYALTGGFWFAIVPGDGNEDGAVTLSDIAAFTDCLLGPAGGQIPVRCGNFDADANGTVDLADFAEIQTAFSTP